MFEILSQIEHKKKTRDNRNVVRRGGEQTQMLHIAKLISDVFPAEFEASNTLWCECFSIDRM